MSATELLLGLVFKFRYWGLFLAMALGIAGLPMPDELLLTSSGYMIAQGRMHLGFTMLAAVSGSVAGMSVSYWVGRTAFGMVLSRYGARLGLSRERLERHEKRFEKYGHSILLVGYFIPGMRHVTALLYGAGRRPYGAFALYAALGALLWTSVFALIGVMLGEHWRQAEEWVHREMTAIVAALVLIAPAAWLLRRRIGRQGIGGS
ncbi:MULTISPECIES: DedA family protein [Cohnella]|uniref:DedA family protein n=1 Tax=Cohnella TaxID=329857 RepID=UPI00257B36FC|nr:DedA family protein [Cohnella sp.]